MKSTMNKSILGSCEKIPCDDEDKFSEKGNQLWQYIATTNGKFLFYYNY